MPAFEAWSHQYAACETFFDAYVTCALWSSSANTCEGDDRPLDSFDCELSNDALDVMRADCDRFEAEAGELIDEANTSSRYGADAQAGHDFWLNRNGHGCGFWDGDWNEPAATKLDELATSFGECDLYLADDDFTVEVM